jgi:broad specificity phosphatase PhoE
MLIEELEQIENISEKKLAILIRHADRNHIPNGVFGNDILLNEKGVENAKIFGKDLSKYKVNKIYASPVKRCLQTAELINNELEQRVEIIITNKLGEPGFHVYDEAKAGKYYLKFGYRKIYEKFIQGKNIEGVTDKETLKKDGMNFLKNKTNEQGITLFITHDSLIAHFSYSIRGKIYTKENWVSYLEGCIIDCTDNSMELKNMFTDYWKYLIVATACKLNLFDSLTTLKNVNELSKELKLNRKALEILLKALVEVKFLKKLKERFSLTKMAELLTEKHPQSIKFACMNWSEEHLITWKNLDYTIKTGKSSFEHIYNDKFFDYLNKYPERLDAYHKAMFEYARDDYKYLPQIINFSKHKAIMDVGGSYGVTINAIKNSYHNIKCILFDLPKVIEKVNLPALEKRTGNFFENIPQIADAIILSRVLHDWDNEKASIILKNCFKALPRNGTLYVIENCIDKIDIDLSLLSLNMFAMCKSYERSSEEYKNIIENVGFIFELERKINDLQMILIFTKKTKRI